jgi:glycosyltransferase involved in cell wall biosynthesis
MVADRRSRTPVNRVLLVSLTGPQIDRLAVELAARHALLSVVRRYVNKGRRWERALELLPFIGSSLGRRLPPDGFPAERVCEAGVPTDFASALVHRLEQRLPRLGTRTSKVLESMTERAVAAAASHLVGQAEQVVASYHVALPVFRRARTLQRRTLLDYPMAHHRWLYRFFDEEADRNPRFASALPRFGDRERSGSHLDCEIEMAELILVGSGFARDSFLAHGIAAERLRVIPYGVDTQRFCPPPQPRRRPSPFRVLFVGLLGEFKGISYLLQAYRRFCKVNTELHLVGNIAPGAEVYLPFRDLYRHTAHVPQAQLPEVYRAADVFVLPTLAEGLGLVVLEAMACGLPVIVTPRGPNEVVRDGVDGYVVPAGDSNSIIEALELLYSDAELRLQLGRNARSQAERWSWARYASAVADTILQDSAR